METNQRTAVIVEFSKLLFCFCGFTDTGRPLEKLPIMHKLKLNKNKCKKRKDVRNAINDFNQFTT